MAGVDAGSCQAARVGGRAADWDNPRSEGGRHEFHFFAPIESVMGWGEDPMEPAAMPCHHGSMKTLLSLVLLPFFFAGSGFCLAGLIGGVVGLILLICLFLHFTGGFHTRSKPSDADLSRETTSGQGTDGSAG